MPKSKIPLSQALLLLRSVQPGLQAFADTSPKFVEELGGVDELASRCEMTVIGPVPRLTSEEFQRAATEYGTRMGWTGA